MTDYPIIRPRPDPRKYFGIPTAAPGQGNMLCPTENQLTIWDFLPNNMIRCTKCGRTMSREEATQ